MVDYLLTGLPPSPHRGGCLPSSYIECLGKTAGITHPYSKAYFFELGALYQERLIGSCGLSEPLLAAQPPIRFRPPMMTPNLPGLPSSHLASITQQARDSIRS